jgi:hypothetical protein
MSRQPGIPRYVVQWLTWRIQYFIDLLSLQVVFTLPITHFAHANVVCDRDDENQYRGVNRGCVQC